MALLMQLLTDNDIDGQPVDQSPEARATFQELLEGERGEVLLAEDDSGTLGVITFSYNKAIRYGGEYAQIEELIVDPEARGKSVGALLVQAAVQAAKNHGCREIGLYAMEHNVPFYEKYGFKYVAPELRQRLLP